MWIFCVVFTLLLTPACYTLLRHPKIKRAAVYEAVSDQRCSGCHSEQEVWSYHNPQNRQSALDERYTSWGYYYYVPWWYNTNWYFNRIDPTTLPSSVDDLRPAHPPPSDP